MQQNREKGLNKINKQTNINKTKQEQNRPEIDRSIITSKELIQLIEDSWHQESEKRPSFSVIIQRLNSIKNSL